MDINRRVETFVQLGKKINSLTKEEIAEFSLRARNENGWFTPDSVQHAFDGLSYILSQDKLEEWVSKYKLEIGVPKIVGIIMAGNIPMVGFHDLLSVLISGHFAAIKTSSQDSFLIKLLINWIIEIEPAFKKNISIRERLTEIDAVIATGSDNTSRYFEYYFKGIPNLIRKNRTSVAILNGKETGDELKSLGKDVFWYYGLGCRNVSKVFIPNNYDPIHLLNHFNEFDFVSNNHKYQNNYDYYKSIYLINKRTHLDTGFLLWIETTELVSPLAVVYAEAYRDQRDLATKLKKNEEKIQCIVGKGHVPFGKAQLPELDDYADNVDTLSFLSTI